MLKDKIEKKKANIKIVFLLFFLISLLPFVTCTLGTDTEVLRAATEIKNSMVWVSGGSFELGRNLGTGGGSDVTPVSTVTMTGFYIGKYQVTQAQYQTIMGTNPSYFKNNPASGETQSRRPVEQVTWYDAVEFCNKLSVLERLTPAYTITNRSPSGGYPITGANVTVNWSASGYRLPTEAQWEYAAKGGNGSLGSFAYSGSNNVDNVAWYGNNSGIRTHEVGKKSPNGLGIYDMSGNVWEWCWDWWGNYTSGAKTNPTGAVSGSYRVLRGGGWGGDAQGTRSAYRVNGYPRSRNFNIGFRVVRP